MKTFIKTAGAASLLAMAVGSASVSAAVLPYLTFSQNAGWSNQNSQFNGGPNGLTGLFFNNPTGPDAPANTFADMSWTSTLNNNTSSINLTSFNSSSSPTLATDADDKWQAGEFWVIDDLLQTNNVLNVTNGNNIPDPLWIADTLANLRIFSDLGIADANLLIADLNSKTTIEFYETLNTTGTCPSDAPLGTQCDDIYRIAAIELAPLTFDYLGFKYTIDFALAPGPSKNANGDVVGSTLVCPSADPRCDDVDTEGQVWVFTPEFRPGTSSLYVTMAWSAQEIPNKVPEPSVLALLGFGVLGAAFATRRRKLS